MLEWVNLILTAGIRNQEGLLISFYSWRKRDRKVEILYSWPKMRRYESPWKLLSSLRLVRELLLLAKVFKLLPFFLPS